MIVDTHTHTPKYRDEIPEEEIQYNTVWRPDRPVKVPVNWEEYMKAMEPVDKAIVFGIAESPSPEADEETKAFAMKGPWLRAERSTSAVVGVDGVLPWEYTDIQPDRVQSCRLPENTTTSRMRRIA